MKSQYRNENYHGIGDASDAFLAYVSFFWPILLPITIMGLIALIWVISVFT